MALMTKPTVDDFVSYEQAKSLRDLGYDEKGYFFYTTSFVEGNEPVVVHKGFVLTSTNSEMQKMECNNISAPTHAQAAKWLRGKNVSIEVQYNSGKAKWIGFVRDMITGYLHYPRRDYQSYEEAFSDCISKAISIITQNL